MSFLGRAASLRSRRAIRSITRCRGWFRYYPSRKKDFFCRFYYQKSHKQKRRFCRIFAHHVLLSQLCIRKEQDNKTFFFDKKPRPM